MRSLTQTSLYETLFKGRQHINCFLPTKKFKRYNVIGKKNQYRKMSSIKGKQKLQNYLCSLLLLKIFTIFIFRHLKTALPQKQAWFHPGHAFRNLSRSIFSLAVWSHRAFPGWPRRHCGCWTPAYARSTFWKAPQQKTEQSNEQFLFCREPEHVRSQNAATRLGCESSSQPAVPLEILNRLEVEGKNTHGEKSLQIKLTLNTLCSRNNTGGFLVRQRN